MQEPETRAALRRPWMLAGGAAMIAVVVLAVIWIGARDDDDDGRLAEVAARGAQVMPFDLERTTHRFQPRADGGVQTVVADDMDDSHQVDLIRRHLTEEASRFRAGDFGDPASIHGEEMPGLAELTVGVDQIDVGYEQVAAGARIWYRTDDPVLVEAIHAWFEAQLTDHGTHAESSPSS